jgi:hypothetical protein
MKTIIDQVTLRTFGNKALIQFFIRKKVRAFLGGDIVFNKKEMTLKRPNVDSKNFYQAKSKHISFHVEVEDVPNMLGKYNVIQLDEDTLILKKVKDAQRHT